MWISEDGAFQMRKQLVQRSWDRSVPALLLQQKASVTGMEWAEGREEG